MASNSDNPADPFKKALAEATKVMANNPELNVNYTVDPSGISGDSIRLPQISRRMSREEVLIARGTSDALALYHRYHNEKPTPATYPKGELRKRFTRLWKPRVAKLWELETCQVPPAILMQK